MKRTFLKAMSLLAVASALVGCKHHDVDSPVSFDGVWEGAMTISETGETFVDLIDINGSKADFYNMKYSLGSGYEVNTKKESDIEVYQSDKNNSARIVTVVDGKERTYVLDGSSVMYSTDGESQYFLTSNAMSYYKPLTLEPSLLVKDAEYIGPTKFNNTLLASPEAFTEDFNWEEFLVWALKTAGTTAGGKAVSALLDILFPASGSSTTLDELLDKMNAITDQLNQMTLLYKNSNYENKLNERSKYISELTNYNSEYYIRLSNAKTEEAVSTIIMDWASHSVGGSPVYVQGLNFIDFLLNTVMEQRDIFNMYDLYTYNTTAWECEGYSIREALRASDIAVAAQNLYLTQLYHMLRTDISEDSRIEILDKNIKRFNEFADYIKKRPVEHHNDKVICQIAGAHFVMDAYNFSFVGSNEYRNPSWYSIPRKWMEYSSDMNFMWGPNVIETYNKAITPNEMKCILDYYKGTEWTLAQILIFKAGCKLSMLPVFTTIILTLQSEGYSADWRTIGLDKSIDFYAKYSSDIGPKTVGIGYFEQKGSIMDMYLQFSRWSSFTEKQFWIRTNVLER